MPHRARDASKAAREVARAASHLASEAAALARIYAEHGPAQEAALAAGEASVHAAHYVFELERTQRLDGDDGLEATILESLS